MDDGEKSRRPGYLTDYARHAGISKPAAADQLKRVGIDYLQPFDFDDADRRRAAMRSADRAPFAKPIYADAPGANAGISEAEQPSDDPLFAESQRRREYYKAELARLEYEQLLRSLVSIDEVEAEGFLVMRQVRDAIESVPSRVAGMLAAESDQRRVYDVLMQELRQALEGLARYESPSDAATGGSA